MATVTNAPTYDELRAEVTRLRPFEAACRALADRCAEDDRCDDEQEAICKLCNDDRLRRSP